MTIRTYKIATRGRLTTPDGRELLADQNNQPASDVPGYGSAIPVGNGGFLTAAHLLDGIEHLPSGGDSDARYTAFSESIDGYQVQPAVWWLRPYNAIAADHAYAKGLYATPANDIVYVKTNYNVPTSSISALAALTG